NAVEIIRRIGRPPGVDEPIGRAPVGEDRTADVDRPRPSGRVGSEDVILRRPAEQAVVEGGPPADRQVEIPIHPEDRIWDRGRRRSRPGRAIAKVAFDVSEALREGFPSSCAVIRIRYATPFGTAPRSHAYVLMDPGSVAIGLHVSPPSALAWRTKFAIPTPGP